MALYTKVDQEACIACGLCQMLAPELFTYDEAGIASFKPDQNTGSLPLDDYAKIDFKLAYTRCPTGAIKRSDKPFPQK
ncbi:ferredoxin [Lacticaseibacillus brantae]|nr:ferredoxin [Lacticaseibacillus brantae]